MFIACPCDFWLILPKQCSSSLGVLERYSIFCYSLLGYKSYEGILEKVRGFNWEWGGGDRHKEGKEGEENNTKEIWKKINHIIYIYLKLCKIQVYK